MLNKFFILAFCLQNFSFSAISASRSLAEQEALLVQNSSDPQEHGVINEQLITDAGSYAELAGVAEPEAGVFGDAIEVAVDVTIPITIDATIRDPPATEEIAGDSAPFNVFDIRFRELTYELKKMYEAVVRDSTDLQGFTELYNRGSC